MEIRHLLYFKTVAEELHFRNAAAKLFISQPPLSRQIKELENELGVKLFHRNNKKVALTEAGKYFKTEVDQLLSGLGESRRLVKQIHDGTSGKLRIGYISSTYHRHLARVLREIPLVYPLVKTSLYEVATLKQVKALEEGKLDVGILRTPVPSEKLRQVSLFQDPFVVVLPKAAVPPEETLALQDLAAILQHQSFIFFNQEYAPEYHRQLLEICQRMGFIPDIVHEANNVHSILRLVESGLGVSIVPFSLQEQYSYLSLRFIPIPEIPLFTEVVLAYKPAKLHPATNWFLHRFSGLFQYKERLTNFGHIFKF